MKKSIAILLALLVVCLLTGCGCEHEFEDWSVAQAATCTAAGTERRVCTKCDEVQERPLAMTAHCYENWVVTQPATCTAAGVQKRTCTGCGLSEEQPLAALPHSYGDWQVARTSTCTEAGVSKRTCTGCGLSEEQPLELLEHSYGDWQVTKQPGCLTEGQKQQSCTVCKTAVTAPVAALGHAWAEANCMAPKTCTLCAVTEGTVGDHIWLDATCTAPRTCAVCAAAEGSALGHSWKDATCDTAKTCTVCGTAEGSALGHSWKAATCDDPKTCTVCGATEGDSNGHTYGKNLTCYDCGIKITGEFYKHLAASDFRSIKRSYSQAQPHFAYVTLFVNKDGHICVLTDVWYKIKSNYNDVFLHNLTTDQTIEDPVNYYKKQADRAYGSNKIKYLNMQGEILKILIDEKNNGTYVDGDYLALGT